MYQGCLKKKNIKLKAQAFNIIDIFMTLLMYKRTSTEKQ